MGVSALESAKASCEPSKSPTLVGFLGVQAFLAIVFLLKHIFLGKKVCKKTN